VNKVKQAALRRKGISLVNLKEPISSQMNVLCEPPVAISGEIYMRGSIGAYTYIRSGRLSAGVKKIGRYCSIAPGVTAGDGNHPTNWLSTHPFQWGQSSTFKISTEKADFNFLVPKQKPGGVFIGNDVWIGANAMLMPGVTIGDGAIVGGGSVVTKDVPPYAIVAGVPAKIVRYRFDEATIERLLSLQWWRFEADSLLGISFDDINAAIDQIKEREARGELRLIERAPVRVRGIDLAE
jgi:acetyltransferase-like isoleucine patch superfamily enzyme